MELPIILGLAKACRCDKRMKTIARSIFIGLVCGATAVCSGAIPSINIKMNQGVNPMNDSGVDRVSTSSMQNPATGR